MSRQYSRVFVSLKQDRAGYDYKGKEPSGRCVVETKGGVGKLTIYIQDVKPEIIYKAYIINGRRDVSEGVQVGTLNIDAKGKAELRLEFDPDNVCDTGKSIEDFNVFAVIIPAKNELISPLVGYKDIAVSWKNNFVTFSPEAKRIAEAPAEEKPALETAEVSSARQEEKESVEPEVIPEEIEVEEVAEPETTPEEIEVEEAAEPEVIPEEIEVEEAVEPEVIPEEIEVEEAIEPETTPEEIEIEETAEPEIIPEKTAPVSQEIDYNAQSESTADKQDIHTAFLEMAKNFSNELKELEQIAFVEPESVKAEGLETREEQPSVEEYSADEAGEASVASVADGIEEMFKTNPSMRPFQKQNIDVEWVRISIREIIFLPIDHWKYMNHSFIVSAYNRFRHLILGKYNENGEYRYFLGVPEIYDSGYKKSAMNLGFTQFKCCENVRVMNGEYGYWIMPVQQ